MKRVRGSKFSLWFAVVILIALGAVSIISGSIPQTTITGKLAVKIAGGPESHGAGSIAANHVVTVNGTNANSGATVFSDSTVTTAKGSSAVVSLGKLGRVEVYPDSTAQLSFTDTSITVSMLSAGRVRVSSSSGVNATTSTPDGQIVSQGDERNEFIVDTTCGNTFVAVLHGRVELRAGSTVKQIAAGGQDTAGVGRPGCTPSNKR